MDQIPLVLLLIVLFIVFISLARSARIVNQSEKGLVLAPSSARTCQK